MNDDNSPIAQPHDELRELLGMHALGLLEAAERATVEAHLDTCVQCRTEFADLAELGPLLRQVDPDIFDPDLADRADRGDVPAALTPEVEAAINERMSPARVLTAADPLPVRRRWLVGSVAAAGLLAVGGLTGWWLAPRPAEVPFETVAVSVERAAEGDGVSVTAGLIPHTWGVEVRMTATGFTAGEHYVVQVVDDTGARRGAGEFIGTGGKPMVCNLNSSVTRAQAVGFVVLDDEQRTVASSTF